MMKFITFGFLFFIYFNAFSQGKVKSETFMESIDRGIIIYEDFCMNCHLVAGEGVVKVMPPLAASDFLMNNRVKSIGVVKFGVTGNMVVNGETYNGTMGEMGLTNKEIADVMNYITNSFGNINDIMFTETEVLKIEK